MLPKDFQLKKFGLTCRLITVSDAPFIVRLRSDPELTRYMLTLTPDINLQIEWIREYKNREKKGLDYYFIYEDGAGIPVGINRISHIDYTTKIGKASSLITVRNKQHYGLKTTVIRYLITFYTLKLESILLDIHKENERAIALYKKLGGVFTETASDYLDVIMDKSTFIINYENRKFDICFLSGNGHER